MHHAITTYLQFGKFLCFLCFNLSQLLLIFCFSIFPYFIYSGTGVCLNTCFSISDLSCCHVSMFGLKILKFLGFCCFNLSQLLLIFCFSIFPYFIYSGTGVCLNTCFSISDLSCCHVSMFGLKILKFLGFCCFNLSQLLLIFCFSIFPYFIYSGTGVCLCFSERFHVFLFKCKKLTSCRLLNICNLFSRCSLNMLNTLIHFIIHMVFIFTFKIYNCFLRLIFYFINNSSGFFHNCYFFIFKYFFKFAVCLRAYSMCSWCIILYFFSCVNSGLFSRFMSGLFSIFYHFGDYIIVVIFYIWWFFRHFNTFIGF